MPKQPPYICTRLQNLPIDFPAGQKCSIIYRVGVAENSRSSRENLWRNHYDYFKENDCRNGGGRFSAFNDSNGRCGKYNNRCRNECFLYAQSHKRQRNQDQRIWMVSYVYSHQWKRKRIYRTMRYNGDHILIQMELYKVRCSSGKNERRDKILSQQPTV